MKNLWKVALPLLLEVGCAAEEADNRVGASVRDSSGVTVVENAGEDVPLEAVVALVADLVPPDSALAAVPWGVAADPATGRVYIADWTGSRVAVFDHAGTYIHSFGAEGEGPGEFRNASAVSMDSNGNPAVWDAGRGLVSRWSAEGDLIEEQRAPVSYWGPGFALSDSTLLTVTSTRSSSDLTMEQRLIAHTPGGTTTLHELPRELAMMELPCATMPAPKLLAPSVIWTSRGDTTHLLNGWPGIFSIGMFMPQDESASVDVSTIIRREECHTGARSAKKVPVQLSDATWGSLERSCSVSVRWLGPAYS